MKSNKRYDNSIQTFINLQKIHTRYIVQRYSHAREQISGLQKCIN